MEQQGNKLSGSIMELDYIGESIPFLLNLVNKKPGRSGNMYVRLIILPNNTSAANYGIDFVHIIPSVRAGYYVYTTNGGESVMSYDEVKEQLISLIKSYNGDCDFEIES